MYVGAPGINKVYAYGRVDYQDQFVRTRGNGVTTRVYITDTIQIDAATTTLVSVSHRSTVLKYHSQVLELDGLGGWRLCLAGDYRFRQ